MGFHLNEGSSGTEGFNEGLTRENHSLPDGTYITFFPEEETVSAVNYDTGEEWLFRENSGSRVRELSDRCLCKEEFASYYQNEDYPDISVSFKMCGHDPGFDVRFAVKAFSRDAG